MNQVTLGPGDVLAAARHAVALRAPYFSSALFGLRMVPKQGLGTLAVDAGLRCFYDPATVSEWGVARTAAVLVHEVQHVIRRHHDRRGARDPRSWNISGDMEINDDIKRGGWDLPDGAVLPELIDAPDGLLAEEYYELLQKQQQQSPKGQDSSDKEGDGKGEVTAGRCGGCAGNPGEHEEDSAVPGRSPGEVEITVRQVAEAVRAHKDRGDVPAGLARWAEEYLGPPKLDWRKVLRRVVRGAVAHVSGMQDYTYARPARRQRGDVLSPSLRQPVPRVSVVLDTSGSMGEQEIGQALAEVVGIAQAAGGSCSVLACDAAVHAVGRVTTGQRDLSKYAVGGGGTDMTVGVRRAVNELKAQVVVLITDGYTPWPGPADYQGARVVVALTPNGKEPEAGHPFVVVRLEGEK